MKKMRQAALNRSTSNVPSSLAELHQVDAGQVAGRVVEEHVLAARIAGVDAAAVGAGVPAVDRRVVLHAGIAAVPGALGHAVHDLAGLVASGRRCFGLVTQWVVQSVVLLDGLHEVVGDADREVRVLEQDRAVGFAVEVRLRSRPSRSGTRAFFSSFHLHSMNSMTSGCQTLSDCILAARRVLPPLFTTAAIWS